MVLELVGRSVRPKIHGYTGCKRTGFVKPDCVKLAKGHLLHDEAGPWNRALQTPVPPWIQGLVRPVSVERGCWPSLYHCSPCSLDPVCSTLCSNCCNCLLARHVILHDFLWYVQCMVHGSQALGWFNKLFFEPVRTSHQPAIWLREVGLLSSQSEHWVDATCSLEIEHLGRAENQALANHPCSAKHVLLHALVKYTIQLALQNVFSYTRYNCVVWA